MTEQIQKTDTQNREIEEVFQELDTIAEKLESGDTFFSFIQKRYGASEILQ